VSGVCQSRNERLRDDFVSGRDNYTKGQSQPLYQELEKEGRREKERVGRAAAAR